MIVSFRNTFAIHCGAVSFCPQTQWPVLFPTLRPLSAKLERPAFDSDTVIGGHEWKLRGEQTDA